MFKIHPLRDMTNHIELTAFTEDIFPMKKGSIQKIGGKFNQSCLLIKPNALDTRPKSLKNY